ncbi:putative malic acid transport protein [Triangularia verruculosa]|uniref:Sulfite efflux pump SSU1 n=1 Tax=Triangularia verruculosa TaxID=2587418 RepID=A0AAN7AWA6_9PEZI|nr:putative malic acid transport protein [Triangularia verruculosa]
MPTSISSPLQSPIRKAIQTFPSQWLLLPQGTGIIAVILHQLDYQFPGLDVISYIFFLLTIILLLTTITIYLTRCILFPHTVTTALQQTQEEVACLTSISITYTSIIKFISLVLVSSWGPGWGTAAYILWWTNVFLAVIAIIGVPFVLLRLYPAQISHLSPASQLPMIAALTVAAGGGTISQNAGLSPQQQVPVIVVSYLFLGCGLPLAFGLDVLYWARLLDRSMLDRQHILQDMILCGPWGQASFGFQILGGAVLKGSFAGYNMGVFLTEEAAKPVGYGSIFVGVLLWGMGTFWWAWAVIGILHAGMGRRGKWMGIPYGLSAWSLVFPWGVYTNAAVQLGKLLDSTAFRVWSTVLTVMLVIIWLWNIGMTIRGLATGALLGLDEDCTTEEE